MKKLLLGILCIIGITSSKLYGQDFRNSYWGDKLETVYETEDRDPASNLRAVTRYQDHDNLHQLEYYDKELGNNVYFVFKDKRLIMGYYEIPYEEPKKKVIVEKYNGFCDMLSSKYNTVRVNRLNVDDSVKVNPNRNISYELLTESVWQTRQSSVNRISLRLFISENEPRIHLMYSKSDFYSSLKDIISRDPERKY